MHKAAPLATHLLECEWHYAVHRPTKLDAAGWTADDAASNVRVTCWIIKRFIRTSHSSSYTIIVIHTHTHTHTQIYIYNNASKVSAYTLIGSYDDYCAS